MYQLISNSESVKRSDGAIISYTHTGDWAVYQQWLADGNTPEPIPIQSSQPLPREIDARRLRLALLQLGKLEAVDQAILTLDKAAQIEWEFATVIKENHPLTQALATNLHLDINAIFELAGSLL